MVRRVFFSVMVASSAALAQQSMSSVFGPGEQLSYDVSFVGLPAGTAQITVGWETERDGKTVWPIVCVGQTSSLAQAFRVKDRFVSFYDPAERKPVGADFFVSEGNYKRKERYRYDRVENKVVATKQAEGREPVQIEYEFAQGTMDLASAAFALRNEPLDVGKSYELPIFTGTKSYQMHAVIEGKETLSSSLGSFEVLRVKLNGDFNGNLKTKADITLFVTADASHVPLRVSAEFVIGSIVIDAVKYEPGRTSGVSQ